MVKHKQHFRRLFGHRQQLRHLCLLKACLVADLSEPGTCPAEDPRLHAVLLADCIADRLLPDKLPD
eukprot:scaffold673832_cov39-Prasinocladus_malaysianus.AAC.1